MKGARIIIDTTDIFERDSRLEALRLTGLLDTPPERVFDRFTTLASKIVGVPVALISLVDEKRQFFKSQFGLPEPLATERETPLTHSFCKHVAASSQPLIVNDARLHPLVKENLAVSELGIVAYAGVPLITPQGETIGSFCAIDVKPHEWTEQDVDILSGLAESVMTEIELRIVAQQFQDSYLALRKTESMRDEMVHMLVHDLRTPLNSLLGGLQALESLMTPDAVQRQMLDISLRGGRSLAQMVNNIMDVSRGEVHGFILDRKEVSPTTLVNHAIEQVEQLSQQKLLSLTCQIPSATPPILADGDRLGRVLVNLLGNAIQHTPKGGSVCVSTELSPGEELLTFRVSDTGVGIPEAEFARIFDKFGQGSSRSSSIPSTGLGLTFCKMVVEEHGGRIWLESDVGVGTTFYFTIPCHAPA